MKKLITLLYIILCGNLVFVKGQEPPQTKEYPANTLPQNIFKDSHKLKQITLPESLIQIGSQAFDGCNNLEQIVISSNATNQFCTEAFPDQEGLTLYVPSEGMKAALEMMFHFTATKIVVGTPQSLSKVSTTLPFAIAITNNTLSITFQRSGKVRLYSFAGELLYEAEASPNQTQVIQLSQGTYLILFDYQALTIIL